MKFLTKILLVLLFLFLYSAKLFATVYKEANLVGGYSRYDHLKNSIGFEYYKKFANKYGDYLTADLQMRLSYDPDNSLEDGWGVEIHNAWLDYKLGLGKSLKIGHFSPVFGLEPDVDTHGTILQTLITDNIGFKKDWGIDYKTIFGKYDLELAVQLGSGMGIARKDNSGIFSGRLAVPSSENFQYGLSAFYGQVLKSKNTILIPDPEFIEDSVLKKRVGVDMQYNFKSYVFKTEVAIGKDDNKDVAGFLGQMDYLVPNMQNLEFNLQYKIWDEDLDNSSVLKSSVIGGCSYKVNSDITIRLAYLHDMHSVQGEKERKVLLQFYLFGE